LPLAFAVPRKKQPAMSTEKKKKFSLVDVAFFLEQAQQSAVTYLSRLASRAIKFQDNRTQLTLL